MSSLLLRRLENWAVLHLSPRHRLRMHARYRLASRYLTGEGLEIGALHAPLPLPTGVRVRYVDYVDQGQLRFIYPELAWVPIVTVDIIENGEVLSSIADASNNFVVANHVIEHCENPVQTLENWLRVISAGNILFITVPDMKKTFDRNRQLTSIEHLICDYKDGPESSRVEHMQELFSIDCTAAGDEFQPQLFQSHPHYHVWTMESFAGMLESARQDLGLPFVVEEMRYLDAEFAAVLRKSGER